MIKCANCEEFNLQTAHICAKCGAPLLEGVSGTLMADPAAAVTTPLPLGTSGTLVANPATVTVPQPPSGQQPQSPPSGTSTPPPPQSLTIPWKVIGLIVLILFIVGLPFSFALRQLIHHDSVPTPTPKPSLVGLPSLPPKIYTVQFPNKEYVGVNDGSQPPFDIKQPGSQNLRKQTMDVLQKNQDPTSLWNDYLEGANSNDAEISIYRENRKIKNNYPYFTLIVGLDFSASTVRGAQTPTRSALQTPTRSALQGIYLAQKEFNDNSNNTTKMQLLLANTGDDPSYVSAVAAQIAGIVQQDKDKRIRGIIGWQTSVRTQAMLDALHQDNVELPMVSETASYDNLTDAPNFFSIAASDEQQATLAVALIRQQKDSQVIVFKDDYNLYSQNIAQDFEDNFPGCAPKSPKSSTCIEVPFTTEQTQETEYTTTLRNALKGHDINHLAVFFTGSTNYDMLQLQGALAHFSNVFPFPIFTGDAGYVAQPVSYDRWYVLAYAYHDEWLRLMGLVSPFSDEWEKPMGLVSPFSQAYDQTFNPHNRFKGYSYEIPDAVSIISYDTAQVVAQSVNKVLSSQSPNLQSALATITNANPWQGVSGQIAFDKKRHLVDRALIVLEVKTAIDPKTGKKGGSFQMICLQDTFSSTANNSLPQCPT